MNHFFGGDRKELYPRILNLPSYQDYFIQTLSDVFVSETVIRADIRKQLNKSCLSRQVLRSTTKWKPKTSWIFRICIDITKMPASKDQGIVL